MLDVGYLPCRSFERLYVFWGQLLFRSVLHVPIVKCSFTCCCNDPLYAMLVHKGVEVACLAISRVKSRATFVFLEGLLVLPRRGESAYFNVRPFFRSGSCP